jgi:hypothetical protein
MHYPRFILIALLCTTTIGCTSPYHATIPNIKRRASIETILCEEHVNQLKSSESKIWEVFVRAGFAKEISKNIAVIEVRQNGLTGPLVTVGSGLQEHDGFVIGNSKWEILKIGNDGANVNDYKACTGGFIHVRKV